WTIRTDADARGNCQRQWLNNSCAIVQSIRRWLLNFRCFGLRILKLLWAEHQLVRIIDLQRTFSPIHVDNKVSGSFCDGDISAPITFEAIQTNYQRVRTRKFHGWIYRSHGRIQKKISSIISFSFDSRALQVNMSATYR